MSWIEKFLPRREATKVAVSEKTKKPLFTVGKRVCFLHKTKHGDVYGIGEIKTLKSTPVNKAGKIESYLYLADIQPLYEVPHKWILLPVTEEHCSDDYLTFPLPDAAILGNRLEIRMKLPMNASNHKILKAVSGGNFCLATYYDFLHFSCGTNFFLSAANT